MISYLRVGYSWHTADLIAFRCLLSLHFKIAEFAENYLNTRFIRYYPITWLTPALIYAEGRSWETETNHQQWRGSNINFGCPPPTKLPELTTFLQIASEQFQKLGKFQKSFKGLALQHVSTINITLRSPDVNITSLDHSALGKTPSNTIFFKVTFS